MRYAKTTGTFAGFFGILFLMFWMFCVSAWGMNIYKLCQADFEAPYKTEIIRAVGIFPPVGAVVGFMDIGEENDN